MAAIFQTSAHQWQINWPNLTLLVLAHIFGLHGLWYSIWYAKWKMLFYSYVLVNVATLGITAGVHRLWSHKTYKAKLPLKILLCFLHSMTLQTTIYDWVWDHRLHHSYTDTDADPYNNKRGLFFSHMGWLMVERHPDVIAKSKTLNLKDLEADPVVMFQKRYNWILAPPVALLLPALVPWYFWNENFFLSWIVCCILRYLCNLHVSLAVNSIAHRWGSRPYDKNIGPADSLPIALLTFGEGWHNYHHVFPWDYKTGELGSYGTNWTTAFIDFMATIGWAYDLKTASQDLINKRVIRTGDAGAR